jgi:hypothetical protein
MIPFVFGALFGGHPILGLASRGVMGWIGDMGMYTFKKEEMLACLL